MENDKNYSKKNIIEKKDGSIMIQSTEHASSGAFKAVQINDKRGYHIHVYSTKNIEASHHLTQKKTKELETQTGLCIYDLCQYISLHTTDVHFYYNGKYADTSYKCSFEPDSVLKFKRKIKIETILNDNNNNENLKKMETKINIYQKKSICINALLTTSNVFYFQFKKQWFKFFPCQHLAEDGKLRGFWFDKTKTKHIANVNYNRILTEKQYLARHTAKEKNQKELIKNNELLVGTYGCYVLRGVAYNALVQAEIVNEKGKKMYNISIMTEDGKLNKTVARNKIATYINLSSMQAVINPDNLTENEIMFEESEKEEITTGETFNQLPVKEVKEKPVKELNETAPANIITKVRGKRNIIKKTIQGEIPEHLKTKHSTYTDKSVAMEFKHKVRRYIKVA
jgi:hypothetical protein